MSKLQEIRKSNPEYENLTDQELADRIYNESYSDRDRTKFDVAIGLRAAPPATPPAPPPRQMPSTQERLNNSINNNPVAEGLKAVSNFAYKGVSDLYDTVAGGTEIVADMGVNALGGVLRNASVLALDALPNFEGKDKGLEVIDSVANMFDYEPRSDSAKRVQKQFADKLRGVLEYTGGDDFLMALDEEVNDAKNLIENRTGSRVTAEATFAAPQLLLDILPVGLLPKAAKVSGNAITGKLGRREITDQMLLLDDKSLQSAVGFRNDLYRELEENGVKMRRGTVHNLSNYVEKTLLDAGITPSETKGLQGFLDYVKRTNPPNLNLRTTPASGQNATFTRTRDNLTNTPLVNEQQGARATGAIGQGTRERDGLMNQPLSGGGVDRMANQVTPNQQVAATNTGANTPAVRDRDGLMNRPLTNNQMVNTRRGNAQTTAAEYTPLLTEKPPTPDSFAALEYQKQVLNRSVADVESLDRRAKTLAARAIDDYMIKVLDDLPNVNNDNVMKQVTNARSVAGRVANAKQIDDIFKNSMYEESGARFGYIARELGDLMKNDRNDFFDKETKRSVQNLIDNKGIPDERRFARVLGMLNIDNPVGASVGAARLARGVFNTARQISLVAPTREAAKVIFGGRNANTRAATRLREQALGGKRANEIIETYLRAVPRGSRDPVFLANYLANPNVELDDIKRIGSKFEKEAIETAKGVRLLRGLASGTVLQSPNSLNEEEEDEPIQ